MVVIVNTTVMDTDSGSDSEHYSDAGHEDPKGTACVEAVNSKDRASDNGGDEIVKEQESSKNTMCSMQDAGPESVWE